MSITISSPITGSAQTGLTSPTYTLSADTPPAGIVGKQYAVTALGGTQTGVDVHTATKPFTLTVSRPSVFKPAGVPSPVTNVIPRVGSNAYQFITRKGVKLSGSSDQTKTMIIRTTIEVPAGADTNDAASVRAALSAHIGAILQASSGAGDTAVSGVL